MLKRFWLTVSFILLAVILAAGSFAESNITTKDQFSDEEIAKGIELIKPEYTSENVFISWGKLQISVKLDDNYPVSLSLYKYELGGVELLTKETQDINGKISKLKSNYAKEINNLNDDRVSLNKQILAVKEDMAKKGLKLIDRNKLKNKLGDLNDDLDGITAKIEKLKKKVNAIDEKLIFGPIDLDKESTVGYYVTTIGDEKEKVGSGYYKIEFQRTDTKELIKTHEFYISLKEDLTEKDLVDSMKNDVKTDITTIINNK